MDFLSNSLSLSAIISCLIVAISVVAFHARRSLRNRKRYHPVAGTVFHLLFNFRRLHHFMTDLARKHRTYRLLGLFRTEVYTADPANVEHILKTNFENYGKVPCYPTIFISRLKKVIDGTLIFSDEFHRSNRELYISYSLGGC